MYLDPDVWPSFLEQTKALPLPHGGAVKRKHLVVKTGQVASRSAGMNDTSGCAVLAACSRLWAVGLGTQFYHSHDSQLQLQCLKML